MSRIVDFRFYHDGAVALVARGELWDAHGEASAASAPFIYAGTGRRRMPLPFPESSR